MSFEAKEMKEYDLIKIDSKSGLSVIFADVGATVVEIRYDGKVMTYAPADIDKLMKTRGQYFGKTIGRLNGRIKDSHLEYDDICLELEPNEGKTCLHGGFNSISTKRFEYEIEENERSTDVIFEYDSKDDEAGFNGNVHWLVRYVMPHDRPSLRIEFEMSPDQKTLLAPTNHLYFNLGGSKDIMSHVLKIESSKIMKVDDEDLNPIGPIDVPAVLDFRKGMKISEHVNDPELVNTKARGYDHPFVIDEDKRGGIIATLTGNGCRLDAYSDLPCLIVYSNNYPTTGMALTNGNVDVIHGGITLEAVEIPLDYASMLVQAGETRKRFVEYAFGKE
ncbi:MAG: hypothetical protein MJ239_05540 [Bacilli bacterium]|nr:hypothetical protein [Bacilli bacterium]